MDPHEASPLTGSRADEAVSVPATPPEETRSRSAGARRLVPRLVGLVAVSGLAVLAVTGGGVGSHTPPDRSYSSSSGKTIGKAARADLVHLGEFEALPVPQQPAEGRSSLWVSYPGLHWVDGNHTDDDDSKDDGDSSNTPDDATAEVSTDMPSDVPADGDAELSGDSGGSSDGDDDVEFLVYYSEDDTKLYAYNVEADDDSTRLYMRGNFTGDLKIDSPNKFMFWSDPVRSQIYKQDLVTGSTTVISSGRPVMGIAVDPSRGTLYYCNQGDGQEHGSSLSGIDLIDYTGGNHSTVVDLQSLALTPYGVEVNPEFTMVDFNLDDPGMILITAHDGTKGYIYQASLFGAYLKEVYSSSTLDIFGIVLDSDNSMMWWIENRGVANGLYNAMLEDTPESSFVAYLQESYWLAAVWDEDFIYAADYKEGDVYELEVDASLSGELSKTETLAKSSKPRCLAFYYSK